MCVNTWLTETLQFDHMMTRLFSLIRNFVRSASLELSLAGEQTSLIGVGAQDAWLFEDVSKTTHVSELPQYPATGEVTLGESHRLETLASAISDLTASLVSLQKLARSVDKPVVRTKLSDAAMSDFLFAVESRQSDIENELFEAVPGVGPGQIAPQLIAAKVTGRLQKVYAHSDASRFYRGG